MNNEFCEKYLEQINGPFAGINLTRINSDEEFYYKQYVDSLEPFEKISYLKDMYTNCDLHIDIGFGGGFPILPLAEKNPEKKYIGFEARGKKAKVVNQIGEALGLNNAKMFHQRFENVYFDRDAVITFKAVSTVENLLPQFITDKELYVVFYKGPNFRELESLKKVQRDWKVVHESTLEIPMTEGRHVIVFKNKNVLRGTEIKQYRKKTNKNLVSLSDFL